MRFANKALVAGGLGFAVSALVACGSSGGGLLSGTQAQKLNDQLDQVLAAVNDRSCSGVDAHIVTLTHVINSLPQVDPRLVSNLQQGEQLVSSLAEQNCAGDFSVLHAGQHHASTTSATSSTQTSQTVTAVVTNSSTSAASTSAASTSAASTAQTTPTGGTGTGTTPTGGTGPTTTPAGTGTGTGTGPSGGTGLGGGGG
jgi:hypothetical protein